MILLINLLVVAAAGVSMYAIVERHNRESRDPYGYIEPVSSAVITGLFPAIAAPYLFYKMRGPIGIVYGIGFVFGMMVSAGGLMIAVAFALG